VNEERVFRLDRVTLEERLPEFMQVERDFPEEKWFPENYLKEVPGKWDLSLYYEIDQKVTGFLIGSLMRGQNIATLHRLMVDQNYRDRGIGTILYSEFENLCKERTEINTITLQVRHSNKEAIAFYKRNGYIVTEAVPGEMPRYVMEKKLS